MNNSKLIGDRMSLVRDAMALRRWGVNYADATADQREKIDTKIDRPILSADSFTLVHNETRVFTNNLDRGVVDMSRLDYDWHPGEKRWVPWFHVNCDISWEGKTMNSMVLQSDDRVAVEFNGRKA